ncbi:MAG: pilin [Candidatus Paceibacterota bacterium]|jgi:hypothetical protein
MNNKTKISVVAAIILLTALPAMAADIPLLAGFPKDATAAGFVVYFFNLIVAFGSFIAIVIVIMAGIEWMTAEGNPSKIESAKSKIKNTLLGVAVLIGSYVVLNTINPELETIKITQLKCSQGIIVTRIPLEGSNEISQACITDTMSKIGYNIQGTLEWNFQPDSLLAVYTYSEEGFTGTRQEFSCEAGCTSGEISGAKSIFFLWKKAGLYLYDGLNYTINTKPFPLYTEDGIYNLSEKSFDNSTSSIKILNPDQSKEKINYQAIVFTDPNYSGSCSFLAQNVPNMNSGVGGYYPTPIKNNTLSSLIIIRQPVPDLPDVGVVTLYTAPDCAESTSNSSAEVKKCTLKGYGHHNIYNDSYLACTEKLDPGDAIMSLSISGPIGVVLSSAAVGVANGKCVYYDINSIEGGGICQSKLPTAIYDPGKTQPMSFILFPVEKR